MKDSIKFTTILKMVTVIAVLGFTYNAGYENGSLKEQSKRYKKTQTRVAYGESKIKSSLISLDKDGYLMAGVKLVKHYINN